MRRNTISRQNIGFQELYESIRLEEGEESMGNVLEEIVNKKTLKVDMKMMSEAQYKIISKCLANTSLKRDLKRIEFANGCLWYNSLVFRNSNVNLKTLARDCIKFEKGNVASQFWNLRSLMRLVLPFCNNNLVCLSFKGFKFSSLLKDGDVFMVPKLISGCQDSLEILD